MATTAERATPIVLNFPKLAVLRCRPKKVNKADWSLTDRQQRIPWWNQEKIQSAALLFVGCGGLGSNETKIHQQAGVGQMDLVDKDWVEDSNRNRQLFTADDVGKPKAHQVLKNLAPFAVFPTLLRGYCLSFEEWVQQKRLRHYDAVVCGVDNVPTMVAVANR